MSLNIVMLPMYFDDPDFPAPCSVRSRYPNPFCSVSARLRRSLYET